MKTKLLLLFVFITLLGAISASASVPERKGWWKFDDASDLMKATIGNPLTPYGDTPNESVNGPVDGNLAISDPIGHALIMDHGIAPNGGGLNVNEYSFQIDFYVPSPIPSYVCFFQTGPMNDADGDLFIKANGTIGLGALGWSTKTIAADTWYRMIVSAKCGEYYRVYINGELFLEKLGIAVDSRHSLKPLPYIFGDDDGEDPTIFCSELAIWDVPLTEDQAIELGDASQTGFPERKGYWQFDDSNDLTKATIGSPLVLTGTQTAVAGPTDSNHATLVPLGSYLTMNHGIDPNLGGAFVNEWTLQVDFSLPKTETWYAFFQTGSLSDDADLFVSSSANSSGRAPNAIGTASTGYSANTLQANTWYRMLVSVKNGEFFRVYIDGLLWLEGAIQPLDGRWALDPVLQIFQDNDGDDGDINCSELAIWNVALTAEQALELGDATNSSSGIGSIAIRNTAELGQNYPNPFTNNTSFPYTIQEAGRVTFRILDPTGAQINVIDEGIKSPGDYKLELNSSKMGPGVYYLQMIINNRTSTKRMIVVK
ncbi:MAG: T9SS C-terminal target domain-containing protein [Porphyromonadaceae bacterium]|nr:MAG: T9SS C-terminal target domain-containing protein [Porphyromonadaceae bacterium]